MLALVQLLTVQEAVPEANSSGGKPNYSNPSYILLLQLCLTCPGPGSLLDGIFFLETPIYCAVAMINANLVS